MAICCRWHWVSSLAATNNFWSAGCQCKSMQFSCVRCTGNIFFKCNWILPLVFSRLRFLLRMHFPYRWMGGWDWNERHKVQTSRQKQGVIHILTEMRFDLDCSNKKVQFLHCSRNEVWFTLEQKWSATFVLQHNCDVIHIARGIACVYLATKTRCDSRCDVRCDSLRSRDKFTWTQAVVDVTTKTTLDIVCVKVWALLHVCISNFLVWHIGEMGRTDIVAMTEQLFRLFNCQLKLFFRDSWPHSLPWLCIKDFFLQGILKNLKN